VFIHSKKNKDEDFKRALAGQMLVVFVCSEMLRSPRFPQLLHSESWQSVLSAIYIDEAHLIKQTHHWRLLCSHLHFLFKVVGLNIPLLGLSATSKVL
jgi:superfamily II DNA helicase RecQ